MIKLCNKRDAATLLLILAAIEQFLVEVEDAVSRANDEESQRAALVDLRLVSTDG